MGEWSLACLLIRLDDLTHALRHLCLQDPSKNLLQSSAFTYYVQSLLILNLTSDLAKAVKIRDDLLALPSSSSFSHVPAGSSSATSAAASLLSQGANGQPVRVIIDNASLTGAQLQQPEGRAWYGFWRLAGTVVKWFAFATIAVLVMEQAGTVKLGPTANEFEASKKDGGKIITFADVRGVDEAKEELQEIVDFRKRPPSCSP